MKHEYQKQHWIFSLVGLVLIVAFVLFIGRVWFTFQNWSLMSSLLGDLVEIFDQSEHLSTNDAENDWFLVTEVIDGDTIEIETGDRVRYIGIDTPEINNEYDAECGAIKAASTNQRLVEGEMVLLEQDVSNIDDYGRLLRYVYLDDGVMVNEYLVQKGLAKAKSYPPDTKYQERFTQAMELARSLELGVWNPDGCIFEQNR